MPTRPPKTRQLPHATAESTSIYRVLMLVHEDSGITKEAMSVMNSLVLDVFEKLCDESRRLVSYNKKHTLGAKEIQTSVRLIFPGELSKHALTEGSKAVTKFLNK